MGSSDEEAIIRETEAFADAWNAGDPEVAASYFAEDGVRVGAFGDRQVGRIEIAAAYDKLFHHTMPGAAVSLERGSIRMLSPGLALWQAGMEIVPPGAGASLRGHVVQVMQKVGDRWLILEAHPKVFPSPPA